MEPGIDTDILTGRPAGMDPATKKADAQIREEKTLREQARLLGITQTPEAQTLIGVVALRLETRIRELVRADAEANAYQAILTELEVREDMAKKAVEKLTAPHRQDNTGR